MLSIIYIKQDEKIDFLPETVHPVVSDFYPRNTDKLKLEQV